MNPRLFINNVPSLDRLIALEFGRVDDGYFPRDFDRVAEDVWLYNRPGTSEPIGFSVTSISEFDLAGAESDVIWRGPKFDSPTLGLVDASIGATIGKVVARFGPEPTLNRVYFEHAAGTDGDEAIHAWRMCLECGDAMAHFGLGCELLTAGEVREAYEHLRYYVSIAPVIAWNWRWYGAAAEAIGNTAEARKAYLQAVKLCEEYCQEETDAPERLAALGSS
ncbi:MAG: tetratricopeptide repeat protein [Solirubrobacterales bacterium]|nr:tetratricopeptide repeat protein [Solirubrobacterales bacterium]